MGHCVDLHITENNRFSKSFLAEFSFLINQAIRRKLAMDASIAWAIKKFYMAKHNLIGADTIYEKIEKMLKDPPPRYSLKRQ